MLVNGGEDIREGFGGSKRGYDGGKLADGEEDTKERCRWVIDDNREGLGG